MIEVPDGASPTVQLAAEFVNWLVETRDLKRRPCLTLFYEAFNAFDAWKHEQWKAQPRADGRGAGRPATEPSP
jgi:hypothetical protein